jgi:hypothetical protein
VGGTTINLLIENTQGEARNCMDSFLEKARAELRTSVARKAKARRVEQRLQLMRPFVAKMARRFPSEGPAKIAGRLLRHPKFKDPVWRRATDPRDPPLYMPMPPHSAFLEPRLIGSLLIGWFKGPGWGVSAN